MCYCKTLQFYWWKNTRVQRQWCRIPCFYLGVLYFSISTEKSAGRRAPPIHQGSTCGPSLVCQLQKGSQAAHGSLSHADAAWYPWLSRACCELTPGVCLLPLGSPCSTGFTPDRVNLFQRKRAQQPPGSSWGTLTQPTRTHNSPHPHLCLWCIFCFARKYSGRNPMFCTFC